VGAPAPPAVASAPEEPACVRLRAKICAEPDTPACESLLAREAERPPTPSDQVQCRAFLEQPWLTASLIQALEPAPAAGPCQEALARLCRQVASDECRALRRALTARAAPLTPEELVACRAFTADPARVEALRKLILRP
jgi:hypothetical protein